MKHAFCPQYSTLTFEAVLARAMKDPRVVSALPPEKDALRLNKGYLVNLVFSIQGESFSAWMNGLIE